MRALHRFPGCPGGAATAGHSSLCHSRLLQALGRECHLLGTTLATWTLHKLCTLVQSTLSICELSYLMLRMKTSKKGLGGWILTEKKPMKIYWKYGKEIDILLYIDRIIFIKIHIHVQEPVWSCVLCQSLLIREGCVLSDRGCTVLQVFVPQYLILFQLCFLPRVYSSWAKMSLGMFFLCHS